MQGVGCCHAHTAATGTARCARVFLWVRVCPCVDAMQVLERRSVLAYKSHVLVAHSDSFSGVTTEDFLQELAGCAGPVLWLAHWQHLVHACGQHHTAALHGRAQLPQTHAPAHC